MKPKKILAISSGGGHWVQLLRLRPAFEGHRVTYATVSSGYRAEVGDAPFHVIPDAIISSKPSILRSAVGILFLLARTRPNLVISTGSLPGFLAIRIGRLFGARTVWVDSIANAEVLSVSGQRIGPHTDLWLTQWEHLARPEGPTYRGAVL